MDKTYLSTLRGNRSVKRIPRNSYLEICITENWKRLDVNEQIGFSGLSSFLSEYLFFLCPISECFNKIFFLISLL
jgi:hypothetical protein